MYEWQEINPDKRSTWLTEGLHAEFETYIRLGSREAKAEKVEAADVIFQDLQPRCQQRTAMRGCDNFKPQCITRQHETDDRYLQRSCEQVGTTNENPLCKR